MATDDRLDTPAMPSQSAQSRWSGHSRLKPLDDVMGKGAGRSLLLQPMKDEHSLSPAEILEKKREELHQLARRLGVTKSLDPLLNELRPCVYIFPETDDRWDEAFRLGGSRFSGKPDLPPAMKWPSGIDKQGNEHDDAFFMCQFNLAEIPPIEGLALPRHGYWWLFYRSDSEVEEQPAIQIIHDPDPGPLKTRDLPAGQSYTRSLAVRFELGVDLPIGREPYYWRIWDKHSDLYRCWDDLYAATHPRKHVGQLGGYAIDAREEGIELYRRIALSELGRRDLVNADRWLHMEAYEREIEEQENSRFDKPEENLYLQELRELRPKVEWILQHRAAIEAEASRWRILFDLDTGIGSRLDFGGVEDLFIFIRSADLAEGRFDRLAAEMRP